MEEEVEEGGEEYQERKKLGSREHPGGETSIMKLGR